jgi:hypothetical protein
MAIADDESDLPHRAGGALPGIFVTVAALTKIARHLALLASLAIIAAATDRSPVGQFAIFLLVAIAALLHSFAASLRRTADRRFLPQR